MDVFYTTAYQCSINGDCKFSDALTNVPEHTLAAQPVASVHKVCFIKLNLMFQLFSLLQVYKECLPRIQKLEDKVCNLSNS